jgi:predicted RNA binding protein YcfA (HicA-like mRNA interferase family)
MTRYDLLTEKFLACRGPFPYRDLVRLLSRLGYQETDTGGGSRRRFFHKKSCHVIRLHEPHPGHDLKPYMVREIRAILLERGML